MKTVRHILLLTLAAAAAAGNAEVRLPNIIGDNMMLQQQADARLWGWATPGAQVTVTPSWPGATAATAKAAKDGRWQLTVATPEASFDNYTINIKGDGSDITLNDVLVGEVWFCSGQSNMEMPLRGFWGCPIEEAAPTIASAAKYPGIRVAMVPKAGATTLQDDVTTKWQKSLPENAAEFSATGYFFARELSDILQTPVGIIGCAYGGSKVEGWLPEDIVDTYDDFKGWRAQNDTLQEWQRVNVMYNAMLNPLKGYTSRGFLWNQGEANVGMHDTYADRLATMVALWRQLWGDEANAMPFYEVEIPGWNYGDSQASNAAMLREAQHAAAAKIPNAGIVCTNDLVYPFEEENIHARQKHAIGQRLAWMAADKTYGLKGYNFEYPRFESMEVDGNTAVLHFNNRWEGFGPNMALEGFEVAGADKVFHPAQATQSWELGGVKLECPDVDKIEAVRYNFKNFTVGNVHSMMGLPLIPFRTDNWEK